ncbi:MAG TPA: endonuclease [Rhodothermales bacterium]|nr:endonuclease [Rhodothermales bacterium]
MRSPARALAVLALALAALTGATVSAQPQTILFPGQSGATLRASLRAAYRPATRNGGNDELYNVVDRTTVGGVPGVVCVYTGYFVPFDGVPVADPSQDVFNNGAGINQEHTWPQSQLNGGGSALAESDLQHLFPSQVLANSDRGNLAFAEIPDAQTTRWYIGGPPYNQTTIPTSNIDTYSELRASTSWEPREDHKGVTSRSLFYIETMYDDETNEAWFTPQLETMYDWHYAHPTTQAEYDRTFRVAQYQRSSGNTPLPNPFILDSTLIRRAFFPTIIVAAEPGAGAAQAMLTAAPSPFTTSTSLLFVPAAQGRVVVEAYDALGRRVAALYDGEAAPGIPLTFTLDGHTLAPGVYVVRAVQGATVLTRRVVRG